MVAIGRISLAVGSLAISLSPRLRPLVVGYYGEHNLGDDALLQVLLQQLPPEAAPVITARDQGQIRRRFQVATVDRGRLVSVLVALSRCDSLVLGGGSLLQDSTSARSLVYYAALMVVAALQRKPVLLWAQGLGPLHRRSSRWLVGVLLRMTRASSWRDKQSADLASRLGCAGAADHVAPDPVWSLKGPSWHGHGGPIVLCFRPTRQLVGPRWLLWLQALEQLVPDRPLLWLPLHAGQDRGLLDHLQQEGLLSPALQQRSRELHPSDPAEVMQVCAAGGLVLAMRLHGLILAAATGAPAAALSYDPKVSAAAADLGCPVHRLDQVPDPLDLLESWQGCVDQPSDAECVRRLCQGAELHRQVLLNALSAPVASRPSQ